MLSITCFYFGLQRPRCPNSVYLKTNSWCQFLAVQQRDGQSEEWIRIPANRAARHESQMDGNRWLALLGTHCIVLINIVIYCTCINLSGTQSNVDVICV